MIRSPSLLLAATLLLVACANTRPDGGALMPATGTAAGAVPITILVATTRARVNTPAMFSDARLGPRQVDFASVTVSIPPAHLAGEIQWPARPPGDPATDFTAKAATYLKLEPFRAALGAQLDARTAADRDVLLFIHGYNTHFDEGVYRLAQFAHDAGYRGVPMVFSLASSGSLWGYVYDRESAALARDGLEATLAVLAADPKVRRINILAHSIGNYLLMETLRQSAIGQRGTYKSKLGEIVMAAPDIDVGLFRSQLDAMGGHMPAPTVLFVSADDDALGLATTIAGDEARLGDYANAAEFAPAGITVVDLSQLDAGSPGMLSHDKVFASEGLAQLVGARLARGDRLDDNAPRTGDRVAQSVRSLGGAVGAVLDAIIVTPARAVTGN